MDITFGIITDGKNDNLIQKIIESIRYQNIPNYEIIVVGNSNIKDNNINIIQFDETIKPAWITRKKNIITQHAKYDIIVFLHDYIVLCNDWYFGFLNYGNDFDICVTKIENANGRRFRDFTLYTPMLDSKFTQKALLPYDFKQDVNLNKIMYISGSYFIMKKHIALKYPLNEYLAWGQSEDLELCHRLTDDNIFLKCNPFSKVRFLKQKYQCNWEHQIDDDVLKELLHSNLNNYAILQRNEVQNGITQFKSYISVRLQGGLGNQLFQLASAYSFAKQTGKEFYLASLDSPKTVHSSEQYFESIFIKLKELLKPLPYSAVLNENSNLDKQDWISIIKQYNNVVLSGYFQHHEYIDRTFLNMLKFNESILQKYPLIQDCIFIHIRGGDYLRTWQLFVDLRNYYKRAIDRFSGEKFVVFTNDKQYSSQFLNDIDYTYVDENEVDTLYLMSKCKGGICANSSFSWWGAYMNPNRPITLPSKWFNNQWCSTGYYFKEAEIIDV